MILGIPKETKIHEYRVGVTPDGVAALIQEGACVLVEHRAGIGAGFTDQEYRRAGAKVLTKVADIWRRSNLIVKVKEPQPSEFRFLRPGLSLFTFLHLAANPAVAKALRHHQVNAMAYEDVTGKDGRHPILEPMSRIAGHLAGLLGANFLRRDLGGKGICLSSLGSAESGRVLVLGAGNVGREAVHVVCGLGARVVLFDKDPAKVNAVRKRFPGQVQGLCDVRGLSRVVKASDLVIGGILVSGQKTPILVTREMVKSMEPGSVIIDVAVDQGGCVATIRPTTLDRPTYKAYGVVHCGVTNLPSLLARSSTRMLTGATLPYLIEMVRSGMAASSTLLS